jgi:neutral amino acid transport system permease protein
MSVADASADRGPWSGSLRDAAARHPLFLLALVLALVAVGLAVTQGVSELAQASVNGIVAGNYYALGAVGLTLIFGVLRLVNFAHGEFLTLGAYLMLLFMSFDVPLLAAAALGVVATAIFSLGLELSVWRPVRRRGAGEMQLLLFALGLAFFMRNAIAFVATSEDRQTGADVTESLTIGSLRIGRTELIVTLIGIAVIVLVAIGLRSTALGKQTRALADDIELAETTGINTDRVVLVTWAVSGALAGLAGIVYALPSGAANPNIGFSLILSIFAAVVVGGIGNAYGALAGGLLIGLVQEWATLVIEPSVKVAVGFAMLILVLLIRPQGLFGRARSADR